MSVFIQSTNSASKLNPYKEVSFQLGENVSKNDMVGTKVLLPNTGSSTVADIPLASTGWVGRLNKNNTEFAIGMNTSPYLTLYSVNGENLTKIANPDVMPTNQVYDVCFSNNGNYLAITSLGSPYIIIYKKVDNNYVKLTNPDVLPPDYGYGVKFSPDDTYLMCAHATTPFITIYKRSGDTFTKLANPATLPTYEGRSCSISPDNVYYAVGTGNSSVLIYKRSDDTFTYLSSINTSSSTVWKMDFCSNNRHFAFSSGYGLTVNDGYLQVYKRVGDTFSSVINTSTSDQCYFVKFSEDGNFLLYNDKDSYATKCYIRSEDTFTESNRSSTGTYNIRSSDITNDNSTIFSVLSATPFMYKYTGGYTKIYKSSELSEIRMAGYMKESGTSGQTKKMLVISDDK